MKSTLRMTITGYLGFAVMASLLFVPAGTFDYWQAWAFLGIVAVAGWVLSVYFMRTNPVVLERRMPAAESRGLQKTIMAGVYLLTAATVVVSGLDRRFGWSEVPTAVCLAGLVLTVVGICGIGLVLAQNSHASVTIRVESGQELVSTGLYGLVRHPMYTSNVFLMVGLPVALGSYWGLLFAIPSLVMFAVRIRDEEKLLQEELGGYSEYMQQVRYRLVPLVW